MQLIQQIEQQQEQQRLVGAIALHIRQSLQLQDILNTSVQELRQLLKADRALVYQLKPQMRGSVVAESVLPEWIEVSELEIEDTCFQQSQREEYSHGKIWIATNIYEVGLSECHLRLLEQFQVKASLVVPILLKNKETPTLELWGLFIVHQCSAPRQWQTLEVELLKQLTVQLAIAIQQAELYHNLQSLNAQLEAKVQERTAALEESDRRFRAIFNNTFQFTGLLTPDGILLEVNQTALSFGGLKLEDVVNRPFWEKHWWTISPQTQEQLKQAIARAAQGEFIRYEVDVIGANNQIATIDFSLRPLQNESGQVVLLIPEGRDITQRKQTEETLRKSQALLEESQRVARLGNWEYELASGKITWSQGLFHLFNRQPSLLEPTYEENLQLYHPEDGQKLHQSVERAIATGESYKEILRVPQPDGSHCYFEAIGHAEFNADGQVIRLYGTAQDVTEKQAAQRDRQTAEETLRQSEKRWQLAIAGTNEAIWDWDICTNRTFRSARWFAILGYEPHEISDGDEEWETRIHPDDYTRVMAAQEAYLSRQAPDYNVEYRLRCKDGSYRWVRSRAKAVWDEQGNAVRLVGSLGDVSDVYQELRLRKLAEEKLRHSEARFQAFMDNSPVLAWITDTDGQIVYLNQTYLHTFKLQPQQVVGQSIFDLYPTEIAQQHLDRIRATAQTNQVLEVIETAPRPDGTTGEFLVYKFPILGLSAQKLVGRVAIDITERKILERELAHQQQLLDAFISSAPVGLTVLDGKLHFTLVNQALAQMNGIQAAAHIGKTVWEIIPDLARKLEPIFQQVLTMGEPILDVEIDGETPKHPGVKRTWLVSCFPILSQAEQPISVGFVIVEISDRKRAQRMLELQAVITRNIAEGICLIRASDAIIVYANPKFEQMFGYDSGELVGQHVSIVNYGDENNTPEDVNQAIRAAVFQHGEATYEIHNVKKDGTPFWCSATSSVFEHPEYGSVLVAVHQDITEHKQAEEKIKASLKEKEVLLKEIHHRVKNNLGIVSSLLQMQCRRTQDPQVAAILRDSQNRIASIALVHEKLYRSEDLADIDFAQYIPDLTTHLFDSYNVSSSQIKLKVHIDDASLDIETAIPCGLIINELVSNALKYAFVGNCEGEIEVKFYQASEGNLILIIRDNGIGLPENFDTKKNKTLGITLVQGLVKQLRGKLEIQCQQGTQFKISFTNSRT
ncbi:MAG: PAS domain S-box protein [Nostoc sp. ZfuVER08]|uniref:PAS domain S-box protein n=1 Tax=Nostoc punctiforme FACHB-252 TaxID=1357509 RepID=A0ABR8HBV7_NOSPU|nr:PAS domain S-box protein [Nostoc punctiforme]MBD2612786.1 PAS domain S-box protein [Nostoc punctiforme FACHB-252]MBL1198231.1 PAS domain S-box protein [Nostoc sp. GBBB01]MDZ8011464.1 PAS domain S-box protein [Nostoc sp. ZfuVER08]